MSELVAATRRAPEGTKPSASREFRPDIQGLRAIAVLMVLVYHLYPSLLPGGFAGVDVFFVISGYLITGHLGRGFADTGRLSLVDFWGRRARRLIPAAALVLAVTWAVSRIVLPLGQLPDVARQVLASALYFQNWRLAHDAVDYLQANAPATPVQHFWSLSVEEQFYLVWPLLFLLAALAAARRGPGRHAAAQRERTRAAAARVLTAALVAGSLAYSVWDTKADPAAAYFVTTTRMWELGAGGLLALAPAGAARVLARQGWLAWAGLAAVLCSAFTLSGATAFPGYAALLPVAGSAAMIASGSAEGRLGPARLTSARPMVFAGGISYSLYLWHYPVISLFTAWHHKAPGLVTGPVLAAVSVLLAWGTKVAVEDRVRQARVLRGHGWRSVSVALAAVVPVTLAAVFVAGEPAPWHGRLGPGYPGAAALAARTDGSRVTVPKKPVLPPPPSVAQNPDGYWEQGCLVGQYHSAPAPCVYGDTKDPRLTVALVGDSMAGNWIPALNTIGRQEHWKVVVEIHAICPWTAAPLVDPDSGTPYQACDSWGAATLRDLVTTVRPRLVITTADPAVNTLAHPAGGRASHAENGAGQALYWKTLQRRGIAVAAITATPDTAMSAPSCVANSSAAHCRKPRSKALLPDPPLSFAVKAMRGTVPEINMNDFLCDTQTCPAVIGNVLVYIDDHHFTRMFARTLTPYLKRRLLSTGVVQRLISS